GGGSTTLISRPLGETEVQLTNRTQTGSLRQVANGIGVYTTAPTGDLAGYILTGQHELFLQESTAYHLKAYDTYFNPYQYDAARAQWSTQNGYFTNNVF